MAKTEFVVSWERFTRFSVRHYSRSFDHLKDAQEKARKVKADCLVTSCVVYQKEVKDDNGVRKVAIVSWNIPY